MSQFLYLYRFQQPLPSSPQQMQDRMQKWMVWMEDLEKKGHLVSRGQPLENSCSVVKDRKGTFSDGPYAETKDIIGGFSMIEAKDLEEARRLSVACPILEGGGLVE